MERYSNSTREVAQDGRRGALMLTISIKHPDAERFIDAKVDTSKVTGANVSVKIDDEFMRAAIAGKPYHQQFPIDAEKPMYEQDIDARALWKKIIHNAWKSAEPGVLFWDTILRESVPDCYADEGFNTVSTNPCGEIPLCPYDSCRLLALNLYSYVDKPFTAEASFDFAKFRDHVGKAMRMMDDIIDLELEKVEQIIAKIDADPEEADIRYVESNLWKKVREMALKGRRTGLGITAEGDMIAALGMRYGSDEAVAFAVEVHKTLALAAYGASVEMAEERGAFPLYDAARELDNPMIARIREADPALYERMVKSGRRNIAMLTIAPTGTTSLMSADDVGHRTGLPSRLQTPPQDQPVGSQRQGRLRGRHGRAVRRVLRLPPQLRGMGARRTATIPRRSPRSPTPSWRSSSPRRPTTRRRPTTSTGWPRSRCRARSRSGSTTRSR